MAEPALRLTKESQSATIDAAPPYEAVMKYMNGAVITFAASIEDGAPTITPERDTWLRDVNGNLLFDVDKQLLEVAP